MSADPLADVLGAVRLSGAFFLHAECAPPWAAEAPPSGAIADLVMPGVERLIEFHAVARGRCLAWIPGEPAVALEAGDVVCFPQGDRHVLASAAGLPAVPAFQDLDRRPGALPPFQARYGRGPAEAELVCGFFGCDARPFNPLLGSLPRLLRASDRAGPRQGWLTRFLEAAQAEVRSPGPGSAGVLSRLTELLFVELVRRHVEALPPGETGWLAGLRDPHVGRALAALHGGPGEGWTLARLARQAGLARSSLAERFTALVGDPPMQYLARWRMQLAARLLASSHQGVAEVAGRVGYGSEAAFNRAFKKWVGVPPATWRRRRAGRDGPAGQPPAPP